MIAFAEPGRNSDSDFSRSELYRGEAGHGALSSAFARICAPLHLADLSLFVSSPLL